MSNIMRATRRLYRNSDGFISDGITGDAATLVIGEGGYLPEDEVRRLHLDQHFIAGDDPELTVDEFPALEVTRRVADGNGYHGGLNDLAEEPVPAVNVMVAAALITTLDADGKVVQVPDDGSIPKEQEEVAQQDTGGTEGAVVSSTGGEVPHRRGRTRGVVINDDGTAEKSTAILE